MQGSLFVQTRSDRAQMATRISQAITAEEPLHGKLVRVVRDRVLNKQVRCENAIATSRWNNESFGIERELRDIF
jgi:hypothetical protein